MPEPGGGTSRPRPPAPVIAVDGPSGVGKGTLAGELARRLRFHFLDSGALYRLLALAAEREGVPLDDPGALASLAGRLDIAFRSREPGQPPEMLLGGEPVGGAHRSEAIGDGASRLAVYPAVRDALLERQRQFRAPPGLVADGRDMGSVVFPDAAVKIFLTASPKERARRRHKQLIDKGIDVSLAALREEISARDRRDRERSAAPLAPAREAVVLDTSAMSAAAVLEQAMALVAAAGFDKSRDESQNQSQDESQGRSKGRSQD